MVFDKYWQDKKAYDNAHPVEMVTLAMDRRPAFNKNILLANIYDIPNMSDSDLRTFVHNSFRLILNNIFFGSKDSIDYINCFTNERFLDAFIDVVQRMLTTNKYLESDDIVKINNICYDYISFEHPNKSNAVVNRMFTLANMINVKYLATLLGFGIERAVANLIVIARFSNLNPAVFVKRVNFIIICQPSKSMTRENIARIFQTIYEIDRNQNNLINIFPSIMFDVLGDYDEADPRTHWITDEIQEVDSTLNLAILDVLEALEPQTIRKVLVNYSENYYILKRNMPTRFNMQHISHDYEQINRVVYELQVNEDIIVP